MDGRSHPSEHGWVGSFCCGEDAVWVRAAHSSSSPPAHFQGDFHTYAQGRGFLTQSLLSSSCTSAVLAWLDEGKNSVVLLEQGLGLLHHYKELSWAPQHVPAPPAASR